MSERKARYHLLTCPTVQEMEEGLRSWADRHPDRLRVEIAGRTPEGRAILLAQVSDRRVADDDKQIVMFTTPHAATEKNATTSLLRLLKWLIGGDPLAAEIRRRQVIVCMPCNDPDGYTADQRVRDVYGCWSWDGAREPEAHPEAAVLQRVMERYQPESLVSVHGFSYAEQTMWESTGMAWATALSRAYIPEVPRLMNRAAEKEGFLITMGEESDGKLLATGPVPGADEHFYMRYGGVTSPVFAYHRYHTLAMTMETGFEESAMIRLRRLLEIGNDVWKGERYPGYPVNQVGCWGSMAVSAWGKTARERRASRVELWRKAGQLTYGCAHPEPRGTMMAFFSPDPAAWRRITAEPALDAIVRQLAVEGGYDTQAIADFVRITPAERAMKRGPLLDRAASPIIENGALIRLLIPYPDAQLTHLRLDGHPVPELDTGGYYVHHNPGTIVEISIPPGSARPFHVVTCAYETETARRPGFYPEDW